MNINDNNINNDESCPRRIQLDRSGWRVPTARPGAATGPPVSREAPRLLATYANDGQESKLTPVRHGNTVVVLNSGATKRKCWQIMLLIRVLGADAYG